MLISNENLRKRKYKIIIKTLILLLFSFLLAWLACQLIYDNKVNELKNIQAQKLLATSALFNRELGSLSDLLLLLAQTKALANNNGDRWQNQELPAKYLQQIQDHFIQFGHASSKIAQLRWLDYNGQEIVRVDFSAEQAKVAEPKERQNKQARYYFNQAMKVASPNIYFSPIDLNVEHNKVVEPYEPSIRATIQTSTETHLFEGLLIVNYRLDNLLAAIKQDSIAEAQINIVNHQGYWLLNPQPEKEWGFMLQQPQLSLKSESPQLWQYQSQHPAGGDIIINNQLSSFVPLATFSGSEYGADTNTLMLYTISDSRFLAQAHNNSLLIALGIFLSLTLIGLTINWREYRHQSLLIALSLKLRAEQQELKRVNQILLENIARQQLLQDELVEANKLSSLGLMVAGVAHELNTPIGGAIMSVSNAENANALLKKAMLEGITKTQFSEGVDSITSNLNMAKINLDKAVGHIKHFKRLAIDRVNEDYIACSLEVIVADLIISLEPRLKPVKVALVNDIEPELHLISRPGIISQVLENLVVNSLNHGFESEQQGIIAIKARRLLEDKICITVSDNGSGIPQAMQSTLFEPFVTSGRSKGNIGLGLYMVNQWVTKLLAGKLSFVSEQNGSNEFATQFTIILPINTSDSLTS
jgi:signal transduction histidine kinase